MAEKINQIETPLILKKHRIPFVAVTDSFISKDEPIVEDRRLINWKKWLKKHQKQYQALDKSGSQSKTEMVMNSCEKIRPKMEMRNLMEYAAISSSSVTDKYRGNPGFWKVPPLLSNHGNSCLSDVGPVLTKTELNLLPTLEYVDVPICIRKEKNLLNPVQKAPAWECSSYLMKNKQELADTIAKLQLSTPKAANIIARGQGFDQAEKYVSLVPVISIMDKSFENEDFEAKNRESSVSTAGVVILKINNLEIRRDEQSIYELPESASKEITWTLNFSSKKDQKSKQYLYFENTGTVAIIYQWRNAISTPEILPLMSENYASFFFNKNKALILPGQKVEFPVWFQTHRMGTFSESWRMETHPLVSRMALIIRMCGHAVVGGIDTSQLEVNVHLDHCIRNTAVREIIHEIIHTVMPFEPPEPAYKNLYLERKLFRIKNPSYFYHASLVTQLYRLYATASALDTSSWTLSLVDLRNVLLQIKNPDLRHERLRVFSDLCQQCLGFCLFNPVRNAKYGGVYNVLCALADKMEEESDFIKRNCIITDNKSVTSIEIRSRSSPNSFDILTTNVTPLQTTLDRNTIAIYREVFYVRIYELLVEAVEQACAVIDSLNHLNEFAP